MPVPKRTVALVLVAAVALPGRSPAQQPTVVEIISRLSDTSRSARAERRALGSLGASAAEFAPKLLPLLADTNPRVRLGAAAALETISGSKNTPKIAATALLAALSDTLAEVRSSMIAQLRYVAPDDPRTGAAYLRILRSDPHSWPLYRAAALVDSVTSIERDTIIVTLLRVIDEDPDPDTRNAAIETLRRTAASDSRVTMMLERLIENPRQAFMSAHPARITILSTSASLKSDGQGSYDLTRSAMTYIAGSASLVSWRNLNLLDNRTDTTDRPVPRIRSLVFDLTRPVPGSGARSMGVVHDSIGRLHVFYRYSDAGGVRRIIGFEQVGPVGTMAETDRVEMWVKVGTDQYLLQMGPWGMGLFSPRAHVTGEGTTRARITRAGPRSWRVTAPEGSIAQLWNVNDVQKPIAMGLYYFGFDVVVARE